MSEKGIVSEKETSLLRRLRRLLFTPILRQVAKAYVAGDSIADAQAVAAKWARRGIGCTMGFWDDYRDQPRGVADAYLGCIDGLPTGDYASIKLTALGYSEELLGEVATRAQAKGTRLHFDAMKPDSVERTMRVVDRLLARQPALAVGVTLPARWRRSAQDADWVMERGLWTRIVKGQFASDSDIDPRVGFRAVVAKLAGRGRHVGVATHDVELAHTCLAELASAGTNRELELLHGLPTHAARRDAVRAGEKVRIYIGYGRAHLPYVVNKLTDNPKMILWILRGLLRV